MPAINAVVAALCAYLVFAPAPELGGKRSRGKSSITRRLIKPLQQAIKRRMNRSTTAEAIPTAVELIARSIRAGASVRTALEHTAHEVPAAELDGVVERLQGGVTLGDALDPWSQKHSLARDRTKLAALLVLGHQSGASMAASLDRAAATIRQRQSLADEIRALTAQTRMSGLVVGLAPIGFGILITTADPQALSILFTTPIGLVALVLGITLELLGLWWMSRLTAGVASWA